MQAEEKKLTGYPSIDKPWLKYYSEETIYALYALNYIGAVANMVYMTLPPKEILHTIKNTESKLLMVLDSAIPKVSRYFAGVAAPTSVLAIRACGCKEKDNPNSEKERENSVPI